ncbi:helix-turn-helix domain-containing protein [Rhodococcus sp. NPDC058521]|uniref:helix-turn-helix domain-containing protein n=1 Tax=Rhodococcus sp. NPDC058521 TaxID=3346536 RepID=UPI00366499FA
MSSQSFWLDGRRWQTPDADDVEILVDHLVRHGVLARDPVVTEMLDGNRSPLSVRTVERRFRAATGMSRGTVRQIERARSAAGMITAGVPVSDVVTGLDYYDEPHLARALRRFVGQSAQQPRTGADGVIALDPVQ